MRTSSRSTVRSSDISGPPLPRPSAKMGVNQQGRPRNWGPAARRLAGHSRCQALGGSLPWEQSWLWAPQVWPGGAPEQPQAGVHRAGARRWTELWVQRGALSPVMQQLRVQLGPRGEGAW